MNIAAVIPARYQSTRFPGKPLARILGKSMIQRVHEQAITAGCFADIIVATDDHRIRDEVLAFGGHVEMTDKNIESGTERIWAVVEKTAFAAAVNIQGDEPLIGEGLLRDICRALQDQSLVSAARLNDAYNDFISANVVKVVLDGRRQALYFSRAPIPFCERGRFAGFFQHIGVYGYSRDMLQLFSRSPRCHLEQVEKLEQLRFLTLGAAFHIVESDYVSQGVDVPEDIEKIEKILRGSHG
ncbi:MAG: 3-deoxy-manno-octulosonate cytidylyltransferase [Candidatus Aminicenantes bacterium]|nr:3-deoxy-manno-octulosonate cytidylyltransferase [Candidatus Aminicenantes bacterium]